MADALKTGRPFVKFQGTTNEQVSLNNVNVTFLADPGAKLTEMNSGILLKIDGASMITVYDLEVSGASGLNNPGISLQAGNTAVVNLTRTTVRGNAGAGVSMTGGSLIVSQSIVSGNTGIGIAVSGGSLSVSRSTIFSNNGGGISTSNGAGFMITNNFIYKNGNTVDATAGGVGVAGFSSDTNKLEFNTIVDNLAGGGVADAAGVFCDRAGFVGANNLIFRNLGGTTGNVQTLGLCTYGNSFVNAGTSTVDNTPMFVHPNSPPLDYHLTPASPNTIVDAAGQCTGIDFDGDSRPVGPACDLGADERKP